jgi:hypothetical protein
VAWRRAEHELVGSAEAVLAGQEVQTPRLVGGAADLGAEPVDIPGICAASHELVPGQPRKQRAGAGRAHRRAVTRSLIRPPHRSHASKAVLEPRFAATPYISMTTAATDQKYLSAPRSLVSTTR